MTSPPAVIGDVVVVGSSTDDNSRAEMPSGIVRGFDARTGAQLWSWKPLLPPAQNPTSDTSKLWRTGAGNAWTMTADPEHGLVFVPTGSAGPDYNGGLRLGDNKWANSVVALRDKAGELAWGFQLVHHDLWDYDTASPPLLATINHDGRDIPVVIQGNKTGMLYFLNRDADLPVFGVQERPVPQSDVAGEAASPTQPFPLAPPPLVPQKLPITDVWGVTPEEREAVRARLQPLRNEGIFTPPSVRGSLIVPGNVGGMNWSGYAFDPTRGLLIVNVNILPPKSALFRAPSLTTPATGPKRANTPNKPEHRSASFALSSEVLPACRVAHRCGVSWSPLTWRKAKFARKSLWVPLPSAFPPPAFLREVSALAARLSPPAD